MKLLILTILIFIISCSKNSIPSKTDLAIDSGTFVVEKPQIKIQNYPIKTPFLDSATIRKIMNSKRKNDSLLKKEPIAK